MVDSTPDSTSLPDTARPTRVFYGWWIVAASSLVQMLQNAFVQQAYGGYVVLLQGEFGWSKTLLSGVPSMQQLQNGATGPLIGSLLDRVGPRAMMRAGMVLMAVGFMLFSRIHGALAFYAAFFVIAAGANMTGFPTTFAIVHWFERRRSTALSLAGFGNSLGGIAFVLVAFLLARLGWRATAFISGVALLVIGLPIAQVFHHHPSDIGLEVDGGPPTRPVGAADAMPVRDARVDFTLRQAVHHASFWWISLGHASALFVVGAVNVHLISYLTQTHAYTLAEASGIVLLMTVMFGVGTLSGGFIGDRANRQTSSMVCMVMHMAGMLLLAYAVNRWMILAFALVHGYAWGWRGPQMAALRADYFGPTAFGRIMGVSNIVVTLGNMAGPLIAGYVYDQTGSYRIGFNILAAIAAFGSVFFYLAKRPAPLAARASGLPMPR